jgi:hypothetical protein
VKKETIMKAQYVSVWDNGTTITTACNYDPATKTVSDVEDSGVDIDASLEREFVQLADGMELGADDGVTFDY